MFSHFGPVHAFKNLIPEANYLLDAVLVVPVGPVTLIFILFSIFSYISTRKCLQKNYFLYAGWHTHLLRFHGERPYHVRVESQVVVSLGASEFRLPLKVGAF